MAKTLQHRRGTTAELASVTGAIGEIFMDTTKNTLVVMDGTTPGGQALALEGTGGAGASYDQSLNTTDDVVFNSALVGDVSIIGNTIAGVDAYGNTDTLVVDGDLSVKLPVTIGNIWSSTLQNTPGFNIGNTYYNHPAVIVLSPNNFSTADLDVLASLSAGDVLSVSNMSYNDFYGTPQISTINFVISSVTDEFDYYGTRNVTIYSNSLTVDGVNGDIRNNSSGGISFTPYSSVFTHDTTSTVDVTPLSVTSTGVNVTGALTVNGQAITAGGTGASYDQDLNTTDDVVFNSALVGDVSIVGNAIAGVDAYGNADTLVVDGNLSVSHTGSTTVTHSNLNWDIATWFGAGSFPPGASSVIYFSDYGNLDSNTESILLALTAGQQITLVDDNSIQRTYTVVSTATFDGMGGTSVSVYVQEPYTVYSQFTVHRTLVVTTTTVNTELSVTNAGVNVNGTFTVNGAPISGGSSYDQSLNTTDDVVFNSALVGDVSIVGNTISGIDSYGNAGVLVLDGTVQFGGVTTESPANTSSVNKWLKVEAMGTETQYTSTITQFAANEAWWYGGNINGDPPMLQLNEASTQLQQVWPTLSVGTVIEVLVAGDGWYNVTLATNATLETGAALNAVVGLVAYPGTYTATSAPVSIEAIKIPVATSTQVVVPQTYYMPLYK